MLFRISDWQRIVPSLLIFTKEMDFGPGAKEIASEDEENIRNSQKEEIAGRYFIFAILQGIVDQGKILKLPKIGSIMKSNPYVIYSMADGWLEDDRFGTLEDILKRTNHEVIISCNPH